MKSIYFCGIRYFGLNKIDLINIVSNIECMHAVIEVMI